MCEIKLQCAYRNWNRNTRSFFASRRPSHETKKTQVVSGIRHLIWLQYCQARKTKSSSNGTFHMCPIMKPDHIIGQHHTITLYFNHRNTCRRVNQLNKFQRCTRIKYWTIWETFIMHMLHVSQEGRLRYYRFTVLAAYVRFPRPGICMRSTRMILYCTYGLKYDKVVKVETYSFVWGAESVWNAWLNFNGNK